MKGFRYYECLNKALKLMWLKLHRIKKWGRWDLNPQPSDLESGALPLELRPRRYLP